MKFLWAELGEIETKHKAELAQQAKDYALGFAQLSQEPDEEDVAKWDLVPDLDDDDLSTLASYLTDASEGAIVFTDAALSSWANNQYPYVQKMQASLVALV